jgi:hypothetical protein
MVCLTLKEFLTLLLFECEVNLFSHNRTLLMLLGIDHAAPRLLSIRATDYGQEGGVDRSSVPQTRGAFFVVIRTGNVYGSQRRELHAQAAGRVVVPSVCFDNRARQSPTTKQIGRHLGMAASQQFLFRCI